MPMSLISKSNRTSSYLKRRLSNADSHYNDDSHPKRPRVDEETSINEIITVMPLSARQDAVHAENEMKEDVLYAQIKKLQSELEEVRERLVRVEQESTRKSNALSRVVELTHCSICKDPIRDPYTLECGHSACSRCLQTWWMTASGQSNHDPIVAILREDSDERDATSITLHRHHHLDSSVRSRSALHSEKHCPECRQPATRRPAPDYRLRDIVDALRPSPLSPRAQSKRDERWSRHRQNDPWKMIFPSNADGSAIRSSPTQSPYILLPSITQGQIETPLPSFFRGTRANGGGGGLQHRHHHQHRTERRAQPYSVTHPARTRRERRRLEPYDPVREARGVAEEQQERQTHLLSSSSSSQNEHTRVHLEPTSLSWPLNLSFLDASSPDILPPLPLSRSPEPQLRTTPESSSTYVESQSSQHRQLTSSSPSQSQSHLQLPSIYQLLSLPPSSDVTLPPILDNLPTVLERSRYQPNVCRSGIIRTGSNDGDRRNHGARGHPYEEEINEADASNSSDTSGGDAWIGADLED